ncbi:hypothetical protein AAC387_Pa08g2638 [Persea americana]
MSKERDPIERIRKLILDHDLATASDLKDIEREVRKQVDEAIAQAKESPMPDPSELFTNVYVKGYGVENGSSDSKRKRLAGTPEPSDAPEKAQGPMEAVKERDLEDEKQHLVLSLHACNISGQELGKQLLLEHHAMRRFYYPMIELEKTDLGTLVNSQLMCSECLQ